MQLSAIVPRGRKTTLLVSSIVAFWALFPRAGVGAVSYSDAVIKDGPAAYYRLEQPLYAGSSTYSTNIGTGQALHGLYRNFASGELAQSGPQPPTWPGFSADNLAPVFDATDNYVEWTEGASQPTPLDITGPLTLEAWVKLDAGADLSGAPGVVSKYSGSGDQRSYTLRVYTNGKANFAISDNGVWKGEFDFTAGEVLAPNQWYHLAATYTPSESMKLYVNGSMVGELTSSIPASLHSGSAPLWIGVQNVTTQTTRYFPGQIDEVAVYSKALSEEQIAAHYEASLAPALNPARISGLQAWYQIDNGTQLVYESSDSSYRARGWQDSSGNNRIMQQTTVASQPILRQDQLGGYPALKFDGSNDWLSAGDGDFHNNTEGLTVIAVARREGTGGSQAIAAQYKTTTNQREWAMTRNFFTVQENPATYQSSMDASFGSPDTEWHIYTGRWVPGVATEAYLDGILKGIASSPAASMNDTSVALSLGAYADGSNYRWDGMIAEVLVFDRALTEKQHNAVGWYLAQKYGLETAFIPEPSAAVLLGIGMAVMLMSRRRGR